jgi:hypothetical protein
MTSLLRGMPRLAISKRDEEGKLVEDFVKRVVQSVYSEPSVRSNDAKSECY